LPDDQQRHDHAHDVDDVADDPADRTFGFARLKAMSALVARASMPATDAPVRRHGSGFQIHLNFVFCSGGGISVC
jgi:hypothetical protein